MKNIREQLAEIGVVNPTEIYYNLSYDELYEHETKPGLTGFDRAFYTKNGALSVDTGIFTGRSPKDKYVVYDDETKDNVWWAAPGKKGSDNHPITPEIWNHLKQLSEKQLSGKAVYVMDGYAGANENSRLKIRFVTEVAWQAHFIKNMFIRPSEEELKDFTPDFVVLNSCKTTNPNWKEQGLNSEVYVAFNLTERMGLIGGTWYGGEMKKGIFSVMNYYLPLRGMAAMHCSANQGKSGDTAIFFGLSGTGKTTLSADPNRALIGDDEHGWSDEGVFNIEGGCYAKCIGLKRSHEPEIFDAIRFGSLLENVIVDDEGHPDYEDGSLTENTRASYPVDFIPSAVIPGVGGLPTTVIFLTADAFGVLPPISRLSKPAAMYHFVSGYTSKLAGTERGIREPVTTFSTIFGEPFFPMPASVYAEMLGRKLDETGASVFLVNTGWCGGKAGTVPRLSLKYTRAMVNAAINGDLNNVEYKHEPFFNLEIPIECPDVPNKILDPRNLWADEDAYEQAATTLARAFYDNFTSKYPDMPEEIKKAGPQP